MKTTQTEAAKRDKASIDSMYENRADQIMSCAQAETGKPSQHTREKEWKDAPSDRKRELSGLGLKFGATFIPSLDGFAISENDLKNVASERDESKAHAQRLADVAKTLAMRVLQSDFYTSAKDETDNALSVIAQWNEEK